MPIPYLPYTDAELFVTLNGVLPAWALLFLVPRWRATMPIVTVTALFYSVLYVLLAANALLNDPQGDISFADMNSLAGLMKLFSNESTVFAAWVHFVAFDLWTGRYVISDAVAGNGPLWAARLSLPLVLMMGPAGFLLYMLSKGLLGGVRRAPDFKPHMW